MGGRPMMVPLLVLLLTGGLVRASPAPEAAEQVYVSSAEELWQACSEPSVQEVVITGANVHAGSRSTGSRTIRRHCMRRPSPLADVASRTTCREYFAECDELAERAGGGGGRPQPDPAVRRRV